MNIETARYFSRSIATLVFMMSTSIASASELGEIKIVSWGGAHVGQSALPMQWINEPLIKETFVKKSSTDTPIHIAGLKDLIKGAGSDKDGDKDSKPYMDLSKVFSGIYSDLSPAYASGYQATGLKGLIQGAGSGTKNVGGGVVLDGVLSVSGIWPVPSTMPQYDIFLPSVN